MSTLTKSPVRVAQRAVGAGKLALRRHSHTFSPKLYTQPQLFAWLARKVFFKTDYRGITALLEDLPEVRHTLELDRVPHFTTLHKACRRLLTLRRAQRLLTLTVRRFLGHRRRGNLSAFDSTGLECGRRSHSYGRRRAKGDSTPQQTRSARSAKLEAGFACRTHLLSAALPRRGPAVDTDRFVPLLDEALRRVKLTTALADAGYDSASKHRYARHQRGVRSVIPAKSGRPTKKLPTGRYRRLMKRRLNKHYCRYGQRWQAETGFSMIKRRLGSYVRGHSYWSQCRDLMLLAITYNIMLC